jgi:hypothetical protein
MKKRTLWTASILIVYAERCSSEVLQHFQVLKCGAPKQACRRANISHLREGGIRAAVTTLSEKILNFRNNIPKTFHLFHCRICITTEYIASVHSLAFIISSVSSHLL